MTAANSGVKWRRSMIRLTARTTRSCRNPRPKAWITTVATINGTLQAQSARQLAASPAALIAFISGHPVALGYGNVSSAETPHTSPRGTHPL